ncbi:MAG: M10 family metallopeptidase C-terminal domain-containing protein, partial [Gammaproteobacteria bacterium]
ESASIATQFDTITDFRAGDKIDLSIIDANSALTGNQAFNFIGTAAFTTANQNGSVRAFFDAANNRTIVQVSNDADTAVEMEIVLTGQVNLTGQDFIL